MQNARLAEAQAGIKIAGRNINNLRYANDITLMAESKEELKSLLMRVKEESEKADLKFNIIEFSIVAKAREFQKNIYFCFIDCAKTFDCVNHNNCGKFLKRWEYQTTYLLPEKPVCRSRNNS